MDAEQHLKELKKLATAQLKAAKLAARKQGLALVDAQRLEKLEAIAEALRPCFETAHMTRDYADVRDKIGYHGKIWLLDRQHTDRVFRLVNDLKFVAGPMGCMAQ